MLLPFLSSAVFGLNEKSRCFILICSVEKEPMVLEWKKAWWATFNLCPFRPPHTCLPICHMPPYHQSTPNHVSLGLVRRRPRCAACQHFLAQNQISRRKSGQPETPKPGMRPQTQKCTSLFYVMNLAVSHKRRTDAAIRGIDMNLWIWRGRVTDNHLERDTERILLWWYTN